MIFPKKRTRQLLLAIATPPPRIQLLNKKTIATPDTESPVKPRLKISPLIPVTVLPPKSPWQGRSVNMKEDKENGKVRIIDRSK